MWRGTRNGCEPEESEVKGRRAQRVGTTRSRDSAATVANGIGGRVGALGLRGALPAPMRWGRPPLRVPQLEKRLMHSSYREPASTRLRQECLANRLMHGSYRSTGGQGRAPINLQPSASRLDQREGEHDGDTERDPRERCSDRHGRKGFSVRFLRGRRVGRGARAMAGREQTPYGVGKMAG